MSIWDFTPKGDLLTGVAVGVGLAAVPVIIPAAGSGVRAVLKAALKGVFFCYEKAQELGTGLVEGATDLVAEAKSEARSELTAARKALEVTKPAAH
jgi:hypothetical protein